MSGTRKRSFEQGAMDAQLPVEHTELVVTTQCDTNGDFEVVDAEHSDQNECDTRLVEKPLQLKQCDDAVLDVVPSEYNEFSTQSDTSFAVRKQELHLDDGMRDSQPCQQSDLPTQCDTSLPTEQPSLEQGDGVMDTQPSELSTLLDASLPTEKLSLNQGDGIMDTQPAEQCNLPIQCDTSLPAENLCSEQRDGIMYAQSPEHNNESPTLCDTSLVKQLRLEAIFHPKFENENRNDYLIRQLMIQRVQDGLGYLEVTLKHSGSLLLWSGGQRFYSKNSTDNQFTLVGEILLRQHFVRAYWRDQKSEFEKDPSKIEEVYRRCSEFVESNRLTLAFEVVTSFLGDHGDRPKRDYLILTAIADRSQERFFSTAELLDLALQFRLPNNDSWILSSHESVKDLFKFYDSSFESGLASVVTESLTRLAEMNVSSIYPHSEYQGEILEGFVIRYIASPNMEDAMKHMKTLSRLSLDMLTRAIPSSLPSCVQLMATMMPSTRSMVSQVIISDLRATIDEAKGWDDFQSKLRCLLDSVEARRIISRPISSESSETTKLNMSTLANRLVESLDPETRRIANSIYTLDKLNDKVTYNLFYERIPSSLERKWLCMVHVHYDQTFQRFRRHAPSGAMPLFRGFCFELSIDGDKQWDEELLTNMPSFNSLDSYNARQQNGETLMLKMKFLPYMVRTFCCRNGLGIIKKAGPEVFRRYFCDLLSKWGVSPAGRMKWEPVLQAWGHYAHASFEANKDQGSAPLPSLSELSYLRHFEDFRSMFDQGKFDAVVGPSNKCGVSGLLVVVALSQPVADQVASYIANRLGCTRHHQLADDIVDRRFMEAACQPGRGEVVAAVVARGVKKLRSLLNHFRDSISLVLFQCQEADTALFGDDTRKMNGLIDSWRKSKCSQLFELSGTSLFIAVHEDEVTYEPTDDFESFVAKVLEASKKDRRLGFIVLFPCSLPGCGKSSLVGDGFREELSTALLQAEPAKNARKVDILAGDMMKAKFWPFLKRHRLNDQSRICIADKNAPQSSWEVIGQTFRESKSVAIPILPDKFAFQTLVVNGIRNPDGTRESNRRHCYPFSLIYLAVCMCRVLHRPNGSHPGKLDEGEKRACLIVVKFFSFYRGVAAEQMEQKLRSTFLGVGAQITEVVTVPFFRDDHFVLQLSKNLENLLIEAIEVQYGHDLASKSSSKVKDESLEKSRFEEYLDNLENRLRQCVMEQADLLLGATADINGARRCFVRQVVDRVVDWGALTLDEYAGEPFVKFASIDVSFMDVHMMLLSVRNNRALAPLFEDTLPALSSDIDFDVHNFPKAYLGLVQLPHVTLAHFSQLSQAHLRQLYEPICGCKVELDVLSIVWSSRVAALAIEVSRVTTCGKTVSPSKNEFPHITIWFEQGCSAFESNHLLSLVELGSAIKVDLAQPFKLLGEVSLRAG